MHRPGTTTPELALPVSALRALREALEAEVGGDAAARALRHAGHAAGDALYPLLKAGETETDPAQLPEAEFWQRVADLFAARGWGRLHFEAVHPGVGALEAGDWVEADADGGRVRPSCHFTTGALANLLGHAAGAPVGVLEVECRSRGDLRCRFAFGGQDALEAVYGALTQGQDLDRALATLA
jgi:predicted hydrocarbon binding protein